MCRLTAVSISKEKVVYKIVAVERETGEYYSLAMGFCYNDYEEIPVVETQERIIDHFNDDILTSYTFARDMVGRTAGFVFKEDANKLLHQILRSSIIPSSFKIEVKTATLSKDLMYGVYGVHDVYAGRKIAFHN